MTYWLFEVSNFCLTLSLYYKLNTSRAENPRTLDGLFGSSFHRQRAIEFNTQQYDMRKNGKFSPGDQREVNRELKGADLHLPAKE